ncbi:MAG: hypothetical protein C5B59_05445 [Bacteroidetes bacterium]|nr:MAG: hypothetical protein C5B59_05445 [Bacteroidota bacterium]
MVFRHELRDPRRVTTFSRVMKEFWIEFDIGVFAKISYTDEINGSHVHYKCHAYLVPNKNMEATEDDFAFSFSFNRSSNWHDVSPVTIDSSFRQLVDLSEELAPDMVTAIRDFENHTLHPVY